MTAMKIRDLKWKSLPMWPPQWSMSDEQAGEEGVLEGVKLSNQLSTKLLSIDTCHLGDCRKGIMILEDPAHLELVFEKLQENLGRPLTEIGDLEINFSPQLQKYGMKQVRPKSSARNIKRVVNKK
jgi:hypothetical protein